MTSCLCHFLALHPCLVAQVIDLDSDITKSRSSDSMGPKSLIHTGTIDESGLNSANLARSGGGGGGAVDWSQPVGSTITQTADAMDWGAPVSTTSSASPF